MILFSERDAEYSVGKHLPSSTRKVVKQLTGVGNESDLQQTDLNVELVETVRKEYGKHYKRRILEDVVNDEERIYFFELR